MLKPRVLVVEDEADLNATMVSFLNLSGFAADGVRSLSGMKAWLTTHDCELVVLDLGLPDGDSTREIAALGADGRRRIVVATARDQVEDRVGGYARGADNYLVKPVDMRELVAVLTVLSQRLPPRQPDWLLDPLGWHLTVPDGPRIRLTRSEVAVLRVMAGRPGQATERAAIAGALGLHPAGYDPRRLEILIRRLRRKISDATGAEAPIETAHGVGYAFTAGITVRR